MMSSYLGMGFFIALNFIFILETCSEGFPALEKMKKKRVYSYVYILFMMTFFWLPIALLFAIENTKEK